jgi:hypothetical protein
MCDRRGQRTRAALAWAAPILCHDGHAAENKGPATLTVTIDRLTKHVAKLRAGDIRESTVHRFMALLRELLEQRKERSKYQLLTMFCDWALHPELDRSKAGGDVLDILDDIWAGSQNVDQQVQGLLRETSPAKLREQIVELLGASFIDPTVMIEAESSALIIGYVIEDLRGKPVARRANEIEKNIAKRLDKGYRHIADRFYFDRDETGKNQFVLVAKQIQPSRCSEVHIRIPWPIVGP